MFILDSHAATPLYQQLYQQIRAQVLAGKLPANSKLPSVRDLSAELAVGRNTVESAYQELAAEGYLYSKQRSGYFVAALDQDVAPLALRPQPRRPAGVREAAPEFRYDFHPARLDPAGFPTALWRTCYLECLRESSFDLSQYSDPQGDWGLRRNLQQYLERSRGVLCAPDQIVICAGLQQSLEILAHLLREQHTSVAVEDPGYHLPRAVFGRQAFRVVPVPVTPTGIDLDRLKASGCSMVYVTPSHQLPLGCVMPIANRLKLIEWAQAGDNQIIEDDYDSELRYHGKPIPSLQGLRPDGNIFYLGTFSKILSPALRLSYLVLPRARLAAYRELYRDYFSTVSLLEQRTMSSFMAKGHWLRHVRRMRISYQKKHDLLLQAIERQFGRRAVVVGQGAGLHVVLRLTENNPGEAEIIRRAADLGIRLFPFSATCVAGAPDATHLMLGFGGVSAAEIEPGIQLLSRLCQ
jgi:GntR family transcriptional regulator/MocR family aminotransferase